MRQRGRPRHPDVLTPREWDVLSLVREGLSNPEIGQRLGISPDAAKYHVSQILSKLGVTTREEAAAWRPEPSKEPVLRPAWARALWRWWPALAWAGAAIVLAALALLAWGLLRSSDNDGTLVEGSGTPTISAGATGSPPPTAAGFVGIPVTERGAVDLPSDVSVIVETGCINCDGPTTGLSRVYVKPTGEYVTETLFTPATVSLGPKTVQTAKGPEEKNPDIVGYAMTPDASDIVVGVSYGYSLGAPSDVTEVFRSQDGGVSWKGYGQIAANYFMTNVLKGGQTIIGTYPNGPEATLPPAAPNQPTPTFPPNVYEWFPSGDPIAPSLGANNLFSPLLLPSGDLAWTTNDGRVVDASGKMLLRLPGNYGYQHVFDTAKGSSFVLANYQQGSPGYDVTVVNRDLSLGKTFSLGGFASLGPATAVNGHDAFFVNMALETPPSVTATPSASGVGPINFWPALLDITTGDLYPVPSIIANLPSGRNYIVGQQRGPFVLTGSAISGGCANLYAQPSADSSVLDCLADDVLLVDVLHASKLVEATPIDGWVDVLTPSHVHGYVRSEDVTAP